METGFKITEIWAYVVTEVDGTEGIPAFKGPDNTVYPMIAADKQRLKDLQAIATENALIMGKNFELRKFSQMETVETIKGSH